MKKLRQNQLIGAVLAVLGVIALVFSYYIKDRVGEEMGQVRTITSPLSHSGEGGKMAGGLIESRASGDAAGYLQTAEFLMIGGIILIVAGGALIFLYKKKK